MVFRITLTRPHTHTHTPRHFPDHFTSPDPLVGLLWQVQAPPEEDEDEQDGSQEVVTNTFAPYVPKKLGFGGDHPDPVVETTSLAAVEPPNITYKLHLDVRPFGCAWERNEGGREGKRGRKRHRQTGREGGGERERGLLSVVVRSLFHCAHCACHSSSVRDV
jgi:hypothetical protein